MENLRIAIVVSMLIGVFIGFWFTIYSFKFGRFTWENGKFVVSKKLWRW